MNEVNSPHYHKLAPFMYLCFHNTLTMCSNLRANEMLIQSLIWCCDNIMIIDHCITMSLQHHINDWSTFHEHLPLNTLLKYYKNTYRRRGQVCDWHPFFIHNMFLKWCPKRFSRRWIIWKHHWIDSPNELK